MRFLSSLRIPVIGMLRDSQNYISAADEGIGVYEMPHYRAQKDIEEMSKIISWLDQNNAPRNEVRMPRIKVPEVSIEQTQQPHQPPLFAQRR